MSAPKRLVSIAIPGPLKQAYTYHLPDQTVSLQPGQRVLVEFGRTRKVGFFVGNESRTPPVPTKPIVRPIDPDSLFGPDLYEFCSWMAGYYLANVADCLIAALPSRLKGTDPFEKVLADSYAADLIGYRADNSVNWPDFFQRRKFKSEPYEGIKSVVELTREGWTDYYFREATKAGIVRPEYRQRRDAILDFVTAKTGIGDLSPTDEQRAAIDQLSERLGSGFSSTLVHGITGSGKTLVYCHVAQQVVDRGKAVMVLTPEIALTGPALSYFRGFFGDTVTVIHSAMTPRERFQSWQGIREGRYRIVLGPRSALFAPIVDLGLVIVDEEHDSSYKQVDPAPRFHGRDSAIMRARMSNVPVILGSASPSVESYYNAQSGKYKLVKLTKRPGKAVLPKVGVVDMRTSGSKGAASFLSLPLKQKIETTLSDDHQVIVFLNRRGYSSQLKCTDCGHVTVCPECEIKLTYHKAGKRLICHYCGHTESGWSNCPECGSLSAYYQGAGTQKVQEAFEVTIKGAKTLRFDSDTAGGRRQAHELLSRFAHDEFNLLLGTQMVTKGLDLPKVSLVGVLSADQGFDLPDFRATEKTFSRLLQVAGRSGRSEQPGEVMIQTYAPENPAIADAAAQDYESFYTREIATRKLHGYPPFGRLIRMVLSSADRDQLDQVTDEFVIALKRRAETAGVKIRILGPSSCPLAYLRKRHRRHFLVMLANPSALAHVLQSWLAEPKGFGLPSRVRLTVDVDPDDMM